MQYVRSISGSVSKTWNSINPATLSGAIDVIVVENEDGTLACSPFHVRFGKFSLLRPYEKKVEFKVNNVRQDYAMKLGEGGEAFFVFETTSPVPEDLQTSPVVSPVASPTARPTSGFSVPDLEPLDLAGDIQRPGTSRSATVTGTMTTRGLDALERPGRGSASLSSSPEGVHATNEEWTKRLERPTRGKAMTADNGLPRLANAHTFSGETIHEAKTPDLSAGPSRSSSPPPPSPGKEQARHRAIALSKKLWTSNIPSQVNDSGDLMLDMTGYKSSEEDSLRAEDIARQILTEELEGDYDIGSLIGADEKGNLWIYSSEEARDEAARRAAYPVLSPAAMVSSDALSDPGYQSDGSQGQSGLDRPNNLDRRESDSAIGLNTPPDSPTGARPPAESMKNYAKTLRLTSDQLKSMSLKSGPNPISFTVNRATCGANIYLWKHNVPIVISDIDGTITKSDALGHVLNMIGRDWTHLGVAKLYTDISNNGYNIFYLTSRAVGQADTTRNYLSSIVQDGYKLPKGPVIMSPDRTIAALRREIYLRKPEVFKMACLRDIKNLFASRSSPFYAGFGNRLTDALSYRSVNIPSTRIFTINANAEVSLDLLSLSKYKTGYVTMRETVDHFFPPVGMLVHEGGEDFTDFNYWRDTPRDLADFSPTESDDEGPQRRKQIHDSDEEDDGEGEDDILSDDNMEASYMSRDSVDESFLPRPSIDSHLVDEAVRNDDPYDDDEDEADVSDNEEGSRNVEGALSEPSSPTAARTGTGMLRTSLQNLANAFQATGLDGVARS